MSTEPIDDPVNRARATVAEYIAWEVAASATITTDDPDALTDTIIRTLSGHDLDIQVGLLGAALSALAEAVIRPALDALEPDHPLRGTITENAAIMRAQLRD